MLDFASAEAAMPLALRQLLLDGGDISPQAARNALPALHVALPIGTNSHVLTREALLSASACVALRSAIDSRASVERDSVDGAADYQLNLGMDELVALVGAESVDAILAVGRELDLNSGGSGRRQLPLVEAFVRRYTPETRPWHAFHQDRAAVTVNVALSDDVSHGGGRLIGLFADGARIFERQAGTATVHLSRTVHGVSRMTYGSRYSLICFLGEPPAVRRELVRVEDEEGVVTVEWSRIIVEP